MHTTHFSTLPPRRYVTMPPPSSSCLLLSNDIPHHPVWSSIPVSCHCRQGVIDSINVLFLLCYVGHFGLSPPCRAFIFTPFFFAICIVLLPSGLHVFPFLLYLPLFIPPLHHSYQLSSMFSLTHFVLSPPHPSLVALSRFLISVAHLPLPSVLTKVEA